MSGCFVLALTAVLVPLLVLFGLKYGVISNLLDPIKQDPRYREIRPGSSGNFSREWFQRMRERPDVAFVVPRTRSIAATIQLRDPDSDRGRIIDVELIPSSKDDPVLAGDDTPPPTGYDRVVLSARTAARLGVERGARIEGIISRIRKDEQETVILPIEVIGVSPLKAFPRDGLFVSHELLVAIEAFRDGRAVPMLGWEGEAPYQTWRDFAGFRMYADTIDAVPGLRDDLIKQGINVRTRVADIELVKNLDHNLSLLFWIIAATAVAGYGFSLGSSIWANIDRKRRDFSLLRLIGFHGRHIVWFPMLQALITGILGWVLACVAYFLIAALLNTVFAGNFGLGANVCRLLPWHFIVSLVATLIIATASAWISGRRLSRLEPSLGLREAW